MNDTNDPLPKSKLDMPPFDFHQKTMVHDFPTKEIKPCIKMPI